MTDRNPLVRINGKIVELPASDALAGASPGVKGDAATVTVGSTTTGAAGSSASVTNSGTSSAAVLDFTIPRGDKGDTGDTGATGTSGPFWGGPYTPPVSTNFSWINQSTRTVSDKSDRMLVTSPDSNAVSQGLLVIALPSTPYTVTMLGSMMASGTATSGAHLSLALLSSGNAIREIDAYQDISSKQMRARILAWASATSFSSSVQDTVSAAIPPAYIALRVTDSGTTRTFQISSNGKTWATVRSEATNTGVTPTQAGMGFYNNNGNSSAAIASAKFDIFHWSIATSVLGDLA